MGELIRANLRHHSRRYVATLVAVAIAVAFVAASLVFGGALNRGIRDTVAGEYDGAAAVLTVDWESTEEADLRDAQAVVEDLPGVTETYPMGYAGVDITHAEKTSWVQVAPIGGKILQPHELVEGALPSSPLEVVADTKAAERLGISVGDSLRAKNWDGQDMTLTVTGLVHGDEGSFGMGTTDLYATQQGVDEISPGWAVSNVLVALDTDNPTTADQDKTVEEIQTALSNAGVQGVSVETGEAAVGKALESINTSQGALTMMLLVFPVIAASVALIVVGTTFQVVFRQRERELALLRVIGATGKQTRQLMILESVAVGLIGSVLGLVIGIFGGAGIAAAVGVVKSYAVALGSVSWGQSITVLVIGTVLTALAGFRPAVRASSVAPVSALAGNVQPVETVTRKQVVRGTVSGILAVIFGVWAAWLGFSSGDDDAKLSRFPLVLLLAIVAGAALIAFLSYLLPLITRAMGRLGSSESYTLAAANTARNPGRTAATGVAVFIGVTLIAMVTFGAQSLRATANSTLDRTAPIDLVVSPSSGSFTEAELSALGTLTDVEAVVQVQGLHADVTIEGVGAGADAESDAGVDTDAEAGVDETADSAMGEEESDGQSDSTMPRLLLVDEGLDAVIRGELSTAKTGEILVSPWLISEPTLAQVCVGAVCQDLTAIPTGLTEGANDLVSLETAQAFGADLEVVQVWVKVANVNDYQDVVSQITEIGPDLELGGTIAQRAAIDQIVNILVMVVVGLLAVSVLVALVGITNTLSLSVAERRRENGLLRALGMSKRQIRAMLSWEALLIAVVSTVLGILAGAYFGAVGFSALPLGVSDLTLQVPWWQWLAIVVVAIGAALLASVVPGLNASKVSPVEALASE